MKRTDFILSAKPQIERIGNVMYGKYKSGFGGNIVGANGVSFALSTMSGGMREPMIPIVYETK